MFFLIGLHHYNNNSVDPLVPHWISLSHWVCLKTRYPQIHWWITIFNIYIIYIYKHKHNHKWVVYPICRSIPTILLAQIMLIVIYLCHYPRYLTVVSHHITITYGSHEIPSKYHEYPMKFPLKNSFLSINHGPNRGTAHGRPAPSWKRSWLKIHGAYQFF